MTTTTPSPTPSDSGSSITVDVDYTFADLRELNLAHAKRERGKNLPVVIIVAVLIAVIFIWPAIVWNPAGPRPAAPPPPARPLASPVRAGELLRDMVMALLPFVIALFGIWIALKFFLRRVLKRHFDTRGPLQRHHVIELSAERGVIDAEPFARHEYRWDAFVLWHESENLLLLYIAANVMIPLPKRCFASAEQLERCRQLLREMIDTRRSAQRAFEVLPMDASADASANAPLPIPPLPARREDASGGT